MGLFKIINKVIKVLYRLNLLLKIKIHLVYYIAILEPVIRIFFFGLVVAVYSKPPRTVQLRRSYMVLSGLYKPRISQQTRSIC